MNKEEEKPIHIFNGTEIEIPDCCREGHDDCPHVPREQKPKKKNKGL